MTTALEQGLIYAIVALGVYLTFRILNFPDLTVDGSFTLGAAVTAKIIIDGGSPVLATLAGFAAGTVAGVVTGLLHTKGKINGLLAGILTMIALYSVNLRVMGKSNLSLLRENTLVTPLRDNELLGTLTSILIFAAVALVIKLIIDWFLHTDLGLAIQATGDNEEMIRSFGVNTDNTKILTLALSNGLVAMCGGLIAQHQGYADSGMGIGLILVGLASVILGQAIFGSRFIFISTLAVVLGSVLYRVVIYFALHIGFDPNDMKLISAVLVVIALLLPQWRKGRTRRKTKDQGAGEAGFSNGTGPSTGDSAASSAAATVPVADQEVK